MPEATPLPPAWADAVSRFEIRLAGQKLAPKTITARVYHVQRFARAMPVTPERLKREQVDLYLGKSNWRAVNTYNAVRQHIQAFLIWAWDAKVVSRDLAALMPPARRQPTRVSRAAPQSAVDAALETPDDRDRLMVRLSLFAGLKPGEIAQVRADDVQEVDGGHILVARQQSGTTRDVLLRPEIAQEILATPEGYLFPGKIDGHISPAYVSRRLSATLPTGISSRRLRRSFEEAQVRLSWGAQGLNSSLPVERVTPHESSFHPWAWEGARSLWLSGHLRQAVREAATQINSELQTKLGRRDLSDTKLLLQAFSSDAPEPGKPRLKLANDDGGETARSMHTGVMQFGVGCFMAVRNPTTHERGEMGKQEALEKLAALSQLARWLDSATVIRA